MFWFSWTVSASCAGVVRAFSIAPIPQPVTVGIPIYITWFRQSERPDGFVLVQSIVNTGPPSSQAIATVSLTSGQTEGTVEITFNQNKTYVLQAVQTDAQGNTQAAFFTDQQTITPAPSASSTLTAFSLDGTSEAASGNNGNSSTATSIQSATPITQTNASSSTTTEITEAAATSTEPESTSGATSSTPDSGTRSPNNARMRTIIIASTIGGSAFLILLFVIFLLHRNPRLFIILRQVNWKRSGSRSEGENIIIPYSERDGEERRHHNEKVQQNHLPDFQEPEYPPETSDPPRVIPQTDSVPTERPPRERRVVYHNDSGWRPQRDSMRTDGGATSSSVINMPPQYDEAL